MNTSRDLFGDHFSDDAGEVDFVYDPACAGDDRWHYDDPADPSRIVLCESTCAEVQRAAAAHFEVEFACERLFTVD